MFNDSNQRGALVVPLTLDEAQGLAVLVLRLNRAKLHQFRISADRDQARRQASALEALKAALLAAGVEPK